jgi:biopolymer transport protein TolR
MASANIGGGSGGKKSLDAEINLVPFIDLLSMCICFLLMTAVWTQLASVQVKQANGTEGAAVEATSLDMSLKFLSSSKVELSVKSLNKNLRSIEVSGQSTAELMSALHTQLPALKEALKANGQIGAVMLYPKSDVDYGTLISIMDVLRKNHLQNLGVVPVPSKSAGG